MIHEKNRLFKVLEKSKKGMETNETERCKGEYQAAKRKAKQAIARAQEAERKNFCKKLFGEENVLQVTNSVI